MTQQNKNLALEETILAHAKKWFKEKIILSHIERTKKLKNPADFNINPFLAPYLSAFLTGSVTAEGIAKSLIYARALGTSINTSFGQNIQSFISDVLCHSLDKSLSASGSLVSGIDIEFIDRIDNRKKYAQLKLGPDTINKDDVETIHGHFRSILNLSRTNSVPIAMQDLVVGVLYGERNDLNGHYLNLEKNHHYTVLVGDEFWNHLVGEQGFIQKLSLAFSDVLNTVDSTQLLDQMIFELSKNPEIQAFIPN